MKKSMRQRLDRLQRSLPDKDNHEAAAQEAMRHLTDDELLSLRDTLRRARDAVRRGLDPKGLDGVPLSLE
jgi:hypothetical protein